MYKREEVEEMERNVTNVDVTNVGRVGEEQEDLTSSRAILERLQQYEKRQYSYPEPARRQNEATMATLLIAYHLALATESRVGAFQAGNPGF
jgi:hypothetical protein